MDVAQIRANHQQDRTLLSNCAIKEIYGNNYLFFYLKICVELFFSDFLRRHRPIERAPAVDVSTVDCLEPTNNQSAQPLNDSDQPIMLTQWDLVQFAWQVARGMEYMTSRKVLEIE